jgi:uncharacterized protein (DUF58 family)
MFRRGTNRPGVRIRLTLVGWLIVVMGLLVGVAAARTHAPFLFLLFGAMFAALLLSSFLSHWMVAPIALDRNAPDRAWQNQTVHIAYYLRNRRRRGTSVGLQIEELEEDRIESAPAYCLQLPAQGTFRSGGRFCPRRRGRLWLGGVRIRTRFPFWLTETTRVVQAESDMIVWPRRGRLLTNLLHRGAAHASHSAPSETKGGQDEFFGLREYRQGDDPRWVAWKRSANRRLVVREMSKPNPDILMLILDADADAAGEEGYEKLLRFCVTLMDTAFVRGYQVGLALSDANEVLYLPPAAGLGQMRSCLDAVTLAAGNARRSLDEIIETIGATQLRQAQVLVAGTTEKLASAGALDRIAAGSRGLTPVALESLDQHYRDAPIEPSPLEAQGEPGQSPEAEHAA